jgi:hypothetical protein
MPAKMKILGYKKELFIIDTELAQDLAVMLKDKRVANEFVRFHEPQSSGWPDDPIIKSFKRSYQSSKTIREESE